MAKRIRGFVVGLLYFLLRLLFPRFVHAKDAYKLTVRVLCDTEPQEKPFVAYLFGQTKFNQNSVLDAAAMLYKERRGNISIGIMGGGPLFPPSGKLPMWEGYDAWEKELRLRVVRLRLDPGISIFSVEPLPKSNTLTEAYGIVRLAKEMGWPSIYIIAPPFHQVRCFISTMTAALAEYPELKIYNKVGDTLDWDEKGVHSQGVLTGARKDFIDSEWDRVEQYMNLVSPEEALKYLENRDK